MSGPIRNDRPQAAASAPRNPAPQAAAALERSPSMDGDVFNSSPEQLKAAEAVVARVVALSEGSLPLNNAKKKAFLAEARPLLAEAEKAESRLFFAHSPKMDALRDATDKLKNKIEWAEMRSGEKPMPDPVNPFRPLFPASKASEDLLSRGGFWTLLGLPVAIVAPIVDTFDTLARPLQLVAYPFHWLGNQAHKLVQLTGNG